MLPILVVTPIELVFWRLELKLTIELLHSPPAQELAVSWVAVNEAVVAMTESLSLTLLT